VPADACTARAHSIDVLSRDLEILLRAGKSKSGQKNTSKNNQPPIEFPVLESRLSLPFTNAGAMQLN